MRVTAEESGEGDLTVEKLSQHIQGLPDTAVLRIHTDENQLDGKYWRITATWDSADGLGELNLRGDRVIVPPSSIPVQAVGESDQADAWLTGRGQFGEP